MTNDWKPWNIITVFSYLQYCNSMFQSVFCWSHKVIMLMSVNRKALISEKTHWKISHQPAQPAQQVTHATHTLQLSLWLTHRLCSEWNTSVLRSKYCILVFKCQIVCNTMLNTSNSSLFYYCHLVPSCMFNSWHPVISGNECTYFVFVIKFLCNILNFWHSDQILSQEWLTFL